MRGAYQLRTASTNCVGDLHAVRAPAKSNILGFVRAIRGADRGWLHCNRAARVVTRVQLGKKHVGALQANSVPRSMGVRTLRLSARPILQDVKDASPS
jgi:hypothetical protein